MCCTRPPHVPVATIFEISRYMYTRNGLLIRLLKTLRQPTTGFALQMTVDLFAELGNWLANVSSPVEETSSVRS
ncbi:hypothetical protein CSKR_106592 [Clonorchis sinensis]|uniref:Uncharacterized protein n=1 Tax=Clonorchis sinensis TaxID=79923 RepID=A0A3R7DBS2_CLOSI|nr:hypothetical protein CSKR_106592 [Clonorchis sinensis]